MSICKQIKGCNFVKSRLSKMPQVAELYQNKLCKGNHKECARYMLYEKIDADRIPNDLYPNDIERAKLILTKTT